MFFLSIPFALELIAVAMGGLLLIKAAKHAHQFAKFLSYIVIIFGLIGLACTSYYATTAWFNGSYCNHQNMMMQEGQGKQPTIRDQNGKLPTIKTQQGKSVPH